MITEGKVRTVSDQARAMSGGWFGLQAVGGDIGHGTRYIDSVQQLVWQGRNGARQAASYYLGIVDALNSDAGAVTGDLPAEVNAVRAELVDGAGWSEKCATQGHNDAQSWLRNPRTR